MNKLHLIKMGLNARRLFAMHRGRFDEGYAVHGVLAGLFDNGLPPEERVAPKPFVIQEGAGQQLDILGYSELSAEELAVRAGRFADPRAAQVWLPEQIASRPVPLFEEGIRLRFQVRACPTKRLSRRVNTERPREVDAFLAASLELKADPLLDREQVYRSWFEEEVGRDHGLKLESVALNHMKRERVLRRTQGSQRQNKTLMFPDIGFEGVLSVSDSNLFMNYLARGVGRHRAFGFGMLLLRSAGSAL